MSSRRISVIVLLAILSSLLPTAPATARSATGPVVGSLTPPVPEQRKVAPVTDPRLPSLTVGVEAATDSVAVGEMTALTITVANQAPDPARNLVVTLPTPDGTVPMPGAGVVSAAQGWRWTLA